MVKGGEIGELEPIPKEAYTILQSPEFEAWIDGLKNTQAKFAISARLLRIKRDGFFGETKGVGNNISELKFHIGAGYRVYYSIRGTTVVLLLNGGDKSSKTKQQKDIATAKAILDRFNGSNDDDI